MLSTIHNPQSTLRNSLSKALSSVVVTVLLSANTYAGTISWTNKNNGTLDGIAVTVSYTNTGDALLSGQDLSGDDYSYQRLTASESGIVVNNNQDITLTFASAVSHLLLYGKLWRGVSCGASGIYTFNHAPTKKSGFGTGTVLGNTLTIGGTDWSSSNGILYFAGPLTTLTISSDCTGGSSNGFQTLAIDANGGGGGSPVPASLFDFNQPAVIYSKEINVTE